MSALVDPVDLLAERGEPGLVVLHATVELPPPRQDGDARPSSGAPRFARAHIPGARHADLLADLARHDVAGHFARPADRYLAHALLRLGVGEGSRVVTYDDDGAVWSARLWWMLRGAGIAARVLDGGLAGWTEAGGPLETGEGAPPVPARRIGVAPRADAWVDRRDVEDVLAGARDAQLVCALSPEVFSGRAASRYARRGHIPGSRNAPARGLLDARGRVLAPDALAARLAPVLEDPRPVIAYCGGGVSACLVALALHLLGRDDVSVYDGSLEEWAADPDLPLAVLG